MLNAVDLRSQLATEHQPGQQPPAVAIQDTDGWYQAEAVRTETGQDGKPFVVIRKGQKLFQNI
jgi:hypothetical protein